MNNSKNTIAWIILISAPLVAIMLLIDKVKNVPMLLIGVFLWCLFVVISAVSYYKIKKLPKGQGNNSPTAAKPQSPRQDRIQEEKNAQKQEVAQRNDIPLEKKIQRTPRPAITYGDPFKDDRMAEYQRGLQIEAYKKWRKTDPVALMEDRYHQILSYTAPTEEEALAIVEDVEEFLQNNEELMKEDAGCVSVWRLWNHAGSECLDVGLYDKAMECFENGINEKYTDEQRKEATRAWESFRELVERKRRAGMKIANSEGSEKAKAYLERAFQYDTSRNDARVDLEAAAKLDDSLLEVQFYKGVNNQYHRQYEAAIECFTYVIEHKTGYYDESDSHFRRGECYAALKRYEEAVEDYSVVIKHSPADYDVYSRRAFAYKEMGKIGEAEKDNALYERLYDELSYIPGGQIEIGNYSEHLNCNGHVFNRILGE